MRSKPQSSLELRQAFLDFFASKGHAIEPGSPLPQYDNPTLLFTNAGMNQFVDLFLGKEKRAYTRAATVQKCMRVSGKHNDLENVGPSPRHHTFFEMLGNFSFGDYFKADAIDYAWEFLTEWIGLEPARMFATIYLDDDESFELWQKHLSADRIQRFDEKDNFWEMGEVGPCGPNSEIFYYIGDMATMDPSRINAEDDEEFLEVWNLVFMQFNRETDGTLTPLPRPSVDTGMGLERIVRAVQGRAPSNYDTDLFLPAMDMVQELLGDQDQQRDEKYVGYRVIADHGRSATFLIGDGVIPGNSGAPYVLRMIIRRAARFGRKIGFTRPFLANVAAVYIDTMGSAYPELVARRDFILTTLTQEEERFARTLDRALDELDEVIADMQTHGKTEIAGDIAFDLHATHGLPLEITRDIAHEYGYTVDEAGFDAAREAHARVSGGAMGEYDVAGNVYADLLAELVQRGRLEPSGVEYDPYSGAEGAAPIVALLVDGAVVDRVEAGQSAELIVSGTPFYAESGGEVGDSGVIRTPGGQMRVRDTQKARGADGLILHIGDVVDGSLAVGEFAVLAVDDARRTNIRRNHTATHILHQELREALGTHVTQQGSLVAPDRLRFDFSHTQAVSADELRAIEASINAAILANYDVEAAYTDKDEAIKRGAMALFGEKYTDVVRTITIGDEDSPYSLELCGGLHVSRSGEIGAFYFTSEGSVAAGVRRVEAVTGPEAYRHAARESERLRALSRTLNSSPTELEGRVELLLAENRTLQKELDALRRQLVRAQFDALLDDMALVAGVPVLAAEVKGATSDALREMADWFRDRVDSGVAVLATVANDRPLFVATVTDDLIKRGVRAGDLVREMGKRTGGGGGGRPNLAQAGGRDAGRLPEALAAVPELVAAAVS